MIRERVDRLLSRLAKEPQFTTQGRTAFVDLERQEVRHAYTPRSVVEVFLGGRGVNMFYLANLLDPSLDPEHPDQVDNTRGTIWEIHPIMQIEVQQQGRWVALDDTTR